MDCTMGGAVDHVGFGFAYAPAAIIGLTGKATVAILGDSRWIGYGDTSTDTISGDKGAVRPSLNDVSYIAFSIIGTRAGINAVADTVKRRAVAAASGVTHMLNGLGINDIGLLTGAQLLAKQEEIKSFWGNLITVLGTVEPWSDGTFVTVEGQTPHAGNDQRVIYNDLLRAGMVRAGTIEQADVTDSARNSGVWKAGYTDEGLHHNAIGFTALKTSGVFNSAVFVLA